MSAPPLLRLLKFRLPMMVGDDVREAQKALMRALASPAIPSADGVFGNATKNAVTQFQTQTGLVRDGQIGAKTWTALFGTATPVAAQPAAGGATIIVKQPNDPAPPLNEAQAKTIAQWLRTEFGPKIDDAVTALIDVGFDTTPPIDFATIAAIAAKETGFMFIRWINRADLSPEQVLSLCIGDASGDFPGTSRSAYPRNGTVFAQDFPKIAPILVAAGNQMRAYRHPQMSPRPYLYKGYGIFQYDLQNIAPKTGQGDEVFFVEQLWGKIDECLSRLTSELKSKLDDAIRNDRSPSLQDVVRRYNGSGERARIYSVHVMIMRENCIGI